MGDDQGEISKGTVVNLVLHTFEISKGTLLNLVLHTLYGNLPPRQPGRVRYERVSSYILQYKIYYT